MSIICYDSNDRQIRQFYQWDVGQTMRITGIEYEEAPPMFHFCNRLSEYAQVVSPYVTRDGLVVEVPNIFLQQTDSLMIYVYQESSDVSSRTVHTIQIPIVPRPRPSDYEYEENISYPSREIIVVDSANIWTLDTGMYWVTGNTAKTENDVWEFGENKHLLLIFKTQYGVKYWCYAPNGADDSWSAPEVGYTDGTNVSAYSSLDTSAIAPVINSSSTDSTIPSSRAVYNYVQQNTSAVYRYKGSVATVDMLPSVGNVSGDVYNVQENDMNYAWNGTEWDPLGGEADITELDVANLWELDTGLYWITQRAYLKSDLYSDLAGKKALFYVFNDGTGVGVRYISFSGVSNTSLAWNPLYVGFSSSSSYTSIKLLDDTANSVRRSNIADNAINADKISDGAITADKIQTDAVITTKIADGAVTSAKIQNGAVTTDKVASASITRDKIADGEITPSKYQDRSIMGEKIVTGEIKNRHLDLGSVTFDKLAALVQDMLNGAEQTSNMVTAVDEHSTNTQYPSAKATYDYAQSIKADIEGDLDIAIAALGYISQP